METNRIQTLGNYPIPYDDIQSDSNPTLIRGSLIHSDEPGIPIHYMVCEISYGEFPSIHSIRVETDKYGVFKFTPAAKIKEFILRVIWHPWEYKDCLFDSWRERVIYEKKVEIPDLKQDTYVGGFPVKFFEYQTGIPRLKWTEFQPSETTENYAKELAKISVGPKVTTLFLNAIIKGRSLEKIKSEFFTNFTTELEKETIGVTKTREFVASRLFAGFHSPNWRKSTDGTLEGVINFNRYEFDGEKWLPNARIIIRPHLDKTIPPTIEKIALQWRKLTHKPTTALLNSNSQNTSLLEDEKEYTPQDKDFPYALYAFLTASNVVQQNGEHLAKCHIYVESFKIAAERNFRKNPIGDQFRIFGEGVLTINKLGEGVLFGEHGLISATSALTKTAAEQHLKERLGSLDHLDWKPRAPIFNGDVEANVMAVWWEAINEYVESYFNENFVKIVNIEAWTEVVLFSNDIVRHSVPWYPQEGEMNHNLWLDTNEIPYTRIERTVVDGEKKAISPITVKVEPNLDDIKKLKNALAQYIFFATLIHTLKHDIGAEECSDPLYSSMSGSNADPEPYGRILPAHDIAVRALSIFDILHKFKYGFIYENEDHKLPKEFIEVAKKYESKIQKAGFDPKKIRSRVNI